MSPNQAKPSLIERYAKDGPTIYDISGIGHVRGHHLLCAGYDTPEAVAGASLEDLTTIPYLGERIAPEIRDAAREYIKRHENTTSGPESRS
ncbi:helix-hairpin-helix domain-containing protein [Halococcus thailandensis]|uniref:helix-hairpin-helix domain-containing protein n=1 Tax=Halococcus thailandensis TaxID=335952 RepID=UPI001F4CEECC|nr:helix-hairpin-helix domain-containing protein [Halococcus thailandensis]